MGEKWRDYGIEYSWSGGLFAMTVTATSPEDAMERVRAAASRGRCYTPEGIDMVIPAYPGAGLFVRALVWLRNLGRKPA